MSFPSTGLCMSCGQARDIVTSRCECPPYVYRDAEARYAFDPYYHAVVNTLVNAMRSLKMTPGEVRDAAMLAALKFEQGRPFPPITIKTRGHSANCPCDACRYDRGDA